MTFSEIITQAVAELKSKNIDTPALDASLLLAHVLKIDRTALLAMGAETAAEEVLSAFRKILNRRLNGECIAYIVEKKEFWGLDFFVNNSVLVPRPDTEILLQKGKELLSSIDKSNINLSKVNEEGTKRKIKALELCTGSGAIAVSLKKEMPDIEIYATDISVDALNVAKINANNLLPAHSNITFFQGDLYNALPSNFSSLPFANFYLIIANPPYISTDKIKTLQKEVQHEPLIALDGGQSGLEIITRIIEGAPNYLQCGGYLLMEADPRQMETIFQLLENKGFIDIQLHKDLSGQNRVIGGRYEND